MGCKNAHLVAVGSSSSLPACLYGYAGLCFEVFRNSLVYAIVWKLGRSHPAERLSCLIARSDAKVVEIADVDGAAERQRGKRWHKEGGKAGGDM